MHSYLLIWGGVDLNDWITIRREFGCLKEHGEKFRV